MKLHRYDQLQIAGANIAFVTHGVPPASVGGVEENVRQHALHLAKVGASVHVIGAAGGGAIGAGIRVSVRPEYANWDRMLEDDMRRYRDSPGTPIPFQFANRVKEAEGLLYQDLGCADYVVVQSVHSIPVDGYLVYAAALDRVLKRLASEPRKRPRRIVLIGHDSPSADRPDLIARIWKAPGKRIRTEEMKWPYSTFVRRLPDYLRSGVFAFGTNSRYHAKGMALSYKMPLHEVSIIPGTGVDQDALQGASGLDSPLALTPRLETAILDRCIDQADALLFYPARIGVNRKRLSLALEVLSAARKIARATKHRFRNIHLVVTGPLDPHNRAGNALACRRELTNLALALGVERHVTIISDFLSSSLSFVEVGGLYRLAGGLYSGGRGRITESLPGVVLSTSEQECAGMPQVEAIASGTEVITTDLPPIRQNLAEIKGVTYFNRRASATDIANLVLSNLERRFCPKGNNARRRSGDQLKDINTITGRFAWEKLIGELLVPWLVGRRKAVRPLGSVKGGGDLRTYPTAVSAK